jgi:hypothetical protein
MLGTHGHRIVLFLDEQFVHLVSRERFRNLHVPTRVFHITVLFGKDPIDAFISKIACVSRE